MEIPARASLHCTSHPMVQGHSPASCCSPPLPLSPEVDRALPLAATTGTRQSHDQQYGAPTATIDNWKFSFFQRNIRIWNVLPPHLVVKPIDYETDKFKFEHSISQFKTNLQKEFINGDLYMVQPRGIYDRPRLGSTSRAGPLGAVY